MSLGFHHSNPIVCNKFHNEPCNYWINRLSSSFQLDSNKIVLGCGLQRILSPQYKYQVSPNCLSHNDHAVISTDAWLHMPNLWTSYVISRFLRSSMSLCEGMGGFASIHCDEWHSVDPPHWHFLLNWLYLQRTAVIFSEVSPIMFTYTASLSSWD